MTVGFQFQRSSRCALGSVWLTLLGLSTASLSASGLVARGGQGIANSTLDFNQDDTVVAVAPNGEFVVVWRDEQGDDDGSAIVARRFAPDGTPLTSEIVVNATSDGEQNDPAVGIFPDGSFIVVWTSESLTEPGDVLGAILLADGSVSVPEFTIPSATSGAQNHASVAVHADGRICVLWESEQGLTGRDIHGRIYDPVAQSWGPEFVLNRILPEDQENPSVAADPASGGWYAVWEGVDPSTMNEAIYGLDLLPLSPPPLSVTESLLSGTSFGQRGGAQVALDATGRGLAVWEGPDSEGRGVFSREIQAGSPLGSEASVPASELGDQTEPTVIPVQIGWFAVFWVERPTPARRAPEGTPIYVQGRIKSGGNPPPPPPPPSNIVVSSSGSDHGHVSASVSAATDSVVVGWFAVGVEGNPSAPSRAAAFQQFLIPIFSDDFEMGSSVRWSGSFP